MLSLPFPSWRHPRSDPPRPTASAHDKSAAHSADALSADALSADALHRLYLDPVFRYVHRRLPHRESAEDVAAETFAAAFQSLPRLRPGTEPLPWLLGIARKKLADNARKHRRQPALAEEALLETVAAPDETPEHRALSTERMVTLRSILDTIAPDQREAILLQQLEGLSTREIATVLGRSPAATNSLLQRARAGLASRADEFRALLLDDSSGDDHV